MARVSDLHNRCGAACVNPHRAGGADVQVWNLVAQDSDGLRLGHACQEKKQTGQQQCRQAAAENVKFGC